MKEVSWARANTRRLEAKRNAGMAPRLLRRSEKVESSHSENHRGTHHFANRRTLIMNQLKRVFFTSQQRIEQIEGRPQQAVVSITDPRAPLAALKGPWGRTLRIQFGAQDPVRFPGLSGDDAAFSPEHADRITAFIFTLPRSIDTVAIHCAAGISRSGGVARALAQVCQIALPPNRREYNRHVYQVLLRSLLEGASARSTDS
jgi:predicted protein tyrosine phosphatase